jgi:hypothetical protein
MVIRLVSVSDQMPLHEFHDVFRNILGWYGDLGYIVRVHGQEINSFRRKTRSKALHEFELHRQEKFLYICDTLHTWEWDVRVLAIQDGIEGDHAPVCLGGRGAAPPEFCGGPTGYRLMLKRQREGAAMSDPVRLADAVDAARGPSFAADQDEGSQRPVPPLVPKIQVTTINEGAEAQGGLTPDFLALSNIIKAFRPSHRHTVRGMLGNPMPGNGYPTIPDLTLRIPVHESELRSRSG